MRRAYRRNLFFILFATCIIAVTFGTNLIATLSLSWRRNEDMSPHLTSQSSHDSGLLPPSSSPSLLPPPSVFPPAQALPTLITSLPASLSEVPPELVPRLYCVVPTMRRSDKYEQWRSILDTWGPSCNALRFTVDPDSRNQSNNVPYYFHHNGASALVVPLTDLVRKRGNQCRTNRMDERGNEIMTPCHHIWEKVWRGWVWVKDHELSLGDYFFKIDDDTFVVPENMKRFILRHRWTANQSLYFGHVLYTLGLTRPIVAGAMAGMSRATLTVLAEHYKKMEHEYGDRAQFKHGRCVDRDGATEEVTTSRCMRDIGVLPTPLFDDESEPGLVQPHIMIWQPKDLLVKARRVPESWYFSGQPKNLGQLESCCSPRPIAIHFQRNPHDMRQLFLVTHDINGTCVLPRARRELVPKWRALASTATVQGVSGQFMDPVAAVREVDYYSRVQQLLRQWVGLPPLECGELA